MSTASTTYIRSRNAERAAEARARAIREEQARARALADAAARARAQAEAQRRAMEFAQAQELARAKTKAKAAAAQLDRLAADCRRAGLDVELPDAKVKGGTTAQLREWTGDAEAAAARVESRLRAHLTRQAVTSIRAADGERLQRAESASPEAATEDRTEAVADVVSRHLSSEVDEAERVRILADIATLDSGDWQDELRDRIRKANKQIEDTAAKRAEADRLLAELAGHEAADDPRHEAIVAELDAAASGAPVRDDLVARAEALLREYESTAVAADLNSVLEELGYRVNPVDPDLTRGVRHWDITHPEWPEHAVKASVHTDGRFRSEVVRTGGDTAAVETDEERGWEWCNAVQRVRERLDELEYDTEQTEAVAPQGEVRRVERRRTERPAQRERPRP